MTLENLVNALNNLEESGMKAYAIKEVSGSLRPYLLKEFPEFGSIQEEMELDENKKINNHTLSDISLCNVDYFVDNDKPSSDEEVNNGIIIDIEKLSDENKNSAVSQYSLNFFRGRKGYCFGIELNFKEKTYKFMFDVDELWIPANSEKFIPIINELKNAGYTSKTNEIAEELLGMKGNKKRDEAIKKRISEIKEKTPFF